MLDRPALTGLLQAEEAPIRGVKDRDQVNLHV